MSPSILLRALVGQGAYADPTSAFDTPAGGDDGYSNSALAFNSSAVNWTIGNIAGVTYDAFVLYPGVTIPKGARILTAKLTVYASSTLSGTTCKIKIFANAVDSASVPTTRATHVAKARTTAFVSWTLGAQTAGTKYESPDISSVIQEITDRSGWASGNNLMLLLDNDASSNNARRVEISNDYTSNWPTIDITYLY